MHREPPDYSGRTSEKQKKKLKKLKTKTKKNQKQKEGQRVGVREEEGYSAQGGLGCPTATRPALELQGANGEPPLEFRPLWLSGNGGLLPLPLLRL
jgi:hypothetical protein